MKSLTLCMAPIRGYTPFLYRNLFASLFGGFDCALAPFIASRTDPVIKAKHVRDVLPENNRGLPVVPQILGKNANDFIRLANHLHDLGYECVNWNLGCPFPQVAGKGRGSGMLPFTDRIQRFLDEVIPAIQCRLSIKTRLGWRSKEDLLRLIPVFNRYPLAEVVIHPRTGIQRYEGRVDMASFEHALKAIGHPVVYNGDICTLYDFKRLSRRFPTVTRWMIGRGCLADPTLPAAIRTGTANPAARLPAIRRLHDALFDSYTETLDGPSHVLDKMKGYWLYFSKALEGKSRHVKAIKKAKHPKGYLAAVHRLFEEGGSRSDVGDQISEVGF